MADPTLDQIRLRAYQLWQLAGRPEGGADEFWYEAERELQNSDTTDYPNETSDTVTELASCDATGCGPLFNGIIAAFALLGVNAMLLALAFARSVQRAVT